VETWRRGSLEVGNLIGTHPRATPAGRACTTSPWPARRARACIDRGHVLARLGFRVEARAAPASFSLGTAASKPTLPTTAATRPCGMAQNAAPQSRTVAGAASAARAERICGPGRAGATTQPAAVGVGSEVRVERDHG
jgi:hypothetical protein